MSHPDWKSHLITEQDLDTQHGKNCNRHSGPSVQSFRQNFRAIMMQFLQHSKLRETWADLCSFSVWKAMPIHLQKCQTVSSELHFKNGKKSVCCSALCVASLQKILMGYFLTTLSRPFFISFGYLPHYSSSVWCIFFRRLNLCRLWPCIQILSFHEWW